MKRPRVILADGHILLLEAFKNLLQAEFDVVGTFADGRALVDGAVALTPDVIVLDITNPEVNGLMAGWRLKRLLPNVKIIYLTMSLDPDVAAGAFRLGASAYVVKNSAGMELLEAIHVVLRGGSYMTRLVTRDIPGSFIRNGARENNSLTLRQKEVLVLLSEGRSMKQVAHVLNITPRTVAFHKYTIMKHLQLQNSPELIKFAVRHSLAAAA